MKTKLCLSPFTLTFLFLLCNATTLAGEPVFTPAQRSIADQVISLFQNGTPEIQYRYIENLGDGRGYTAGRAGFTSATGDMYVVVEGYTQALPGNPLANYLPRLEKLAENEDASTEGLEGLDQAWLESCDDLLFLKQQDAVVDEFYFTPAIEYAYALEIRYPLSLLCLYDAAIQHGDGLDEDGLMEMLIRTENLIGGTPASGIDERIWLRAFLKIRRETLMNPYNKETRDVWRESVGRVDTLMNLLNKEKLYLEAPLSVHIWGSDYILHP